ncbi:MAG: response regulator [bacterium]|nr:response regulator [bacterium]
MLNSNKSLNKPKKIFVADDDPAIIESIILLLEEFGYEVESTSDGESLYRMEKDYPDLFLLDIWMSGQDGREICKFLKKKKSTKSIPIIMISASREISKSTKESGADDFIAKPYDMNTLLEKISKYI